MRQWLWSGNRSKADTASAAELEKSRALVAALQEELAETNRGLVAVTMELDQRVEHRTRELRVAHEELQQTNSEVMRSALELEQANRELDAFARSVSHDLRAPLRSIGGFSKILRNAYGEQLDQRGRDYLERIYLACGRMSSMIEALLRLSRVMRCEMGSDVVDLGSIAREIAGGLQEADPGRHAEFVIGAGLRVNGDEGLLRAAMENLLSNAWKFTGKVPATRIEVGQEDGAAAFFVRDNGAGFDMAHAHQLFGAFQRLHADSEFPGTGVGLATVQRIVHRHGGQIWALAEEGKGATFYFTLKHPVSKTLHRRAVAAF